MKHDPPALHSDTRTDSIDIQAASILRIESQPRIIIASVQLARADIARPYKLLITRLPHDSLAYLASPPLRTRPRARAYKQLIFRHLALPAWFLGATEVSVASACRWRTVVLISSSYLDFRGISNHVRDPRSCTTYISCLYSLRSEPDHVTTDLARGQREPTCWSLSRQRCLRMRERRIYK